MNNQNKDKIKQLFSKVAKNYDFLNHLLSLGIDRYWRWHTVRIVKIPSHARILDVAAGTGDLSISLCRLLGKKLRIMAIDLSKEMLYIAKDKVKKDKIDKQISFFTADAENLPYKEESFDVVTIAFGIRNVIERKKALKEFLRVTRPGGYLICLEFSHLTYSVLENIYSLYLSKILPHIALLFKGDYSAYKYLSQSIKEFPDQKSFSSLISSSGWGKVRYKNLTFGVVSIHYARKNTL